MNKQAIIILIEELLGSVAEEQAEEMVRLEGATSAGERTSETMTRTEAEQALVKMRDVFFMGEAYSADWSRISLTVQRECGYSATWKVKPLKKPASKTTTRSWTAPADNTARK